MRIDYNKLFLYYKHVFIKRLYRHFKEKLELSSYKRNDNSVILMFHSVLKQEETKKSFYIDETVFNNFLLHYKEYIKPISETLAHPEKHYISITFDDVRDDVYRNAVPLLKNANIPFTLFINTSLIGTDGYLSLSQLLELSKMNIVTIGSHCVNHKPLKNLNFDSKFKEIVDSKTILEKITKRPIEEIAYPYGQCDRTTIKLVSQHYSYGLISYGGLFNKEKGDKKYQIPRQNVDDSNFEKVFKLVDQFVLTKEH